MINIFDIHDMRKNIFSYIYPTKIIPGMVMQYRGSKHSKQYMNEYIGKLFIVKEYIAINLFPYLKVNGIIMSEGIDSPDTLFFPDEDDLKIVLI